MAERPTERRQLSRGSLQRSGDRARWRRRGGEDHLRHRAGHGARSACTREARPSARVPAGAGHGATWAIIVFLVVAAVLVYLLGFGR